MKGVSILFLCGLTFAHAAPHQWRLPELPFQNTAWKVEGNVPTNILSAAQTLFAQGFPNPRGCEYRDIEVVVSGIGGPEPAAVKTRGWVLPVTKSRDTNRFAICWNGLIYPVARVSWPTNLAAEISTAAASPMFNRRGNSAAGEAQTVLPGGAQSTRVLLLLRCGETVAALTNWSPNQWITHGGGAGGGKVPSHDPYLEFASDWAWAMFDRALCAHMRGDEVLALATARQLAEVRPKIEVECTWRGFPPQKYRDSLGLEKTRPYLEFLERFPQLLADLERREKEGPHVGVVAGGLSNLTNQTKRIAALIHDLDLVQAGQSGGIYLVGNGTVAALIQEGDAAIEPLLDCLEHDQRLTRSVSFGRDFYRDRRVIPVSQAAATAIETILHAQFGGGAPEMRAYWNKYKTLKLEDRWYAVLNDDAAGSHWLKVAANIVQPENKATLLPGGGMSRPAPTNAPVRLRGEILRSKADPSVADLMARRALEVPDNDPNAYDFSVACQMGLCLATWDAQAAKPVAQTLSRRCRTVMTYSGQNLGEYITRLAMVRARAGDASAFDDYSVWLPTTTPERLGSSLAECLAPLREFPTNAPLQAAADKLLSDTNSAWSRLPWTRRGLEDPAASALINLPAFRRLVARELGRKEICGSISLTGPGLISFAITNYMNGSRSINLPTGSQATNGIVGELRWCDWIALSLANGKSIPPYDPFAPLEKRDIELEKAKNSLR